MIIFHEYRGERFARRKTNSCYKYDGLTYNFEQSHKSSKDKEFY